MKNSNINHLYFHYLIATFVLLILLPACSFQKSLPEGRYRYTGAKVQIVTENDSINTKKISADLTSSLVPTPNRKILGIPWRLVIYNTFYNKKKDKVTFAKKQAEEPVLYDENVTENVEKILESVAFNDGFFNAEVESTVIKQERLRKANVEYTVKVSSPYKVKKLEYQIENKRIAPLINSQKNKSIIPLDAPYRLSTLKAERQRIAVLMKNRGFYYFDENMLEFIADTSLEARGITLRLKLKKETPKQALRPYEIGQIRVQPDYKISEVRADSELDSLRYNDMIFLFEELTIKPSVIESAVTLEKGELYNPAKHQTTLKRLSNLNTFKFFSVRFEQLPNNDSLLDVRILMTPKIKRTIQGEIGGSYKAELYLTPELSVNYTNRNLFGGSELLTINASGAFNLPQNDTLSYYDNYRLLTTLQKPGLLTPFKNLKFGDKTVGNTQLQLDIERQRYNLRFPGAVTALEFEFPELVEFLNNDPDFIPSFGLTEATISYGFNWRKKPHIRHEFNPLSFGYQRSNYSEKDTIINQAVLFLAAYSSNPQIALNLEDMFFYRPDYIFNLDTRQRKSSIDNYLLRVRVAFAGNRLVDRELTGVLETEAFQSNYFILEPDFRYLAIYNQKNQLALRFAPFITFPFNKEVVLPFFDLYSTGGPSSNRAFAPRTVGPGSRPDTETNPIPFEGLGNIKLEMNAEYRYQISTLFELAAFVDAGNVWQYYQEIDPQQTQFRWNNFYKQLAIGTGIGIRLDFEILLLRFDFGVPLTIPSNAEGERFVGDEINLFSKAYRQDNLQFNFAFGYPF